MTEIKLPTGTWTVRSSIDTGKTLAVEHESSANAKQIGGNHYRGRAIQPWDFVAANNIGFFEGNAIKCLTRWRDKGGVDDLRKARHYIDKLIELETQAKDGDDDSK